jgi:hypothetical protein
VSDPLVERLGRVAESFDGDWPDVRRRAERHRFRLRRRATLVAAAVAVAVLVAAPAVALRGSIVDLFAAADRPPPRVVRFMPAPLRSRTRTVIDLRLPNGAHAILALAPTAKGGFCEVVSLPHSASSGCSRPVSADDRFVTGMDITGPITPLGRIAGGPYLFEGVTKLRQAVAVEIRFADGETAEASLTWVSKPVDAGFFLYAVPEEHWRQGHRPVAAALVDADGDELARVAGEPAFPTFPPSALTEPGGPLDQIVAVRDRRLLATYRFPAAGLVRLWTAPERHGRGRCAWLSSGYPLALTCVPRGQPPAPEEIAVAPVWAGSRLILWGEAGRSVATVALEYGDGSQEGLPVSHGFVVGGLNPAPVAAVARDASGNVLARVSLGTRLWRP